MQGGWGGGAPSRSGTGSSRAWCVRGSCQASSWLVRMFSRFSTLAMNVVPDLAAPVICAARASGYVSCQECDVCFQVATAARNVRRPSCQSQRGGASRTQERRGRCCGTTHQHRPHPLGAVHARGIILGGHHHTAAVLRVLRLIPGACHVLALRSRPGRRGRGDTAAKGSHGEQAQERGAPVHPVVCARVVVL